jgi:hypothetical protein
MLALDATYRAVVLSAAHELGSSDEMLRVYAHNRLLPHHLRFPKLLSRSHSLRMWPTQLLYTPSCARPPAIVTSYSRACLFTRTDFARE